MGNQQFGVPILAGDSDSGRQMPSLDWEGHPGSGQRAGAPGNLLLLLSQADLGSGEPQNHLYPDPTRSSKKQPHGVLSPRSLSLHHVSPTGPRDSADGSSFTEGADRSDHWVRLGMVASVGNVHALLQAS